MVNMIDNVKKSVRRRALLTFHVSLFASALLLTTSCLGGEDEFTDCVQPFNIIYRTQLITNEDAEIQKTLHDTPEEEILAPRLKDELVSIFTLEPTTDAVVKTTMADLQLCFYKDKDNKPEILNHLIENVGAPEKKFPSSLDVMQPYWHAALCGIEKNKQYNGPVSGISNFGQEHAATLSLYQPEATIAYSHRNGIYTGRIQIPAHGQKRTYYCNLYQVNSAVAAVIDPGEVKFDEISAYIARTADRFDVQDSMFYRNNMNLHTLCNRMEETGSQLICLWGACMPCPTILTATENTEEGFYDFIIEIKTKDIPNNRTMVYRATCHVKEPLLAAQLKVLKFRLKPGPEVESVDANVGISVDLEWHAGLNFDDIPLK